jgi:hypothetical protein
MTNITKNYKDIANIGDVIKSYDFAFAGKDDCYVIGKVLEKSDTCDLGNFGAFKIELIKRVIDNQDVTLKQKQIDNIFYVPFQHDEYITRENSLDRVVKVTFDKEYLLRNFDKIHLEATKASEDAVEKYLKNFREKNPNSECGEPLYCGFAWVRVWGVKLNTKLGKEMSKYKFEKFWTGNSGSIFLWNPSNYHGQSMDVKEEGALAYAKIFRNYGFNAQMGSKAD